MNENQIFDDSNWLNIASNSNYFKCVKINIASGERFVVIYFIFIRNKLKVCEFIFCFKLDQNISSD